MTLYKKTIGRYGEDLACEFLTKRGYKIIERNVKLSYKEIDIVSAYKNELIFVEIKTRASNTLGGAENALFSAQIKNLKKAMAAYCCLRRKKLATARLDFIAIDIDRQKKPLKLNIIKKFFKPID
jgi:putative endonuclease